MGREGERVVRRGGEVGGDGEGLGEAGGCDSRRLLQGISRHAATGGAGDCPGDCWIEQLSSGELIFCYLSV